MKLVFEELKAVLFNPVITNQLIENRAMRLTLDTDMLQVRISNKERDMKAKDEFLVKCKADYMRGELAAPLYTGFYEETTREISYLLGEISELKKRIEKATVKLEDPKTILARLRESLDNWERISSEPPPGRARRLLPESFSFH